MTKLELIEALFGLSKTQANIAEKRYFNNFNEAKINDFYDFFVETCNNENIVGDNFFKLTSVFKIAELEFKKRFEDKESFLLWLTNKYKNRAFFRVFAGEFEYQYFAYDSFGKSYEMTNKSIDMLVCLNQFKELTYENGDLIENGVFKEALIDFIFKNQYRIGKDIHLAITPAKIERVLTLDEKRELEKAEEKRLFNENKSRFEKILKSKMAFRNIS